MARNLKSIPSVGVGSASMAMGAKDPRGRRNAQGVIGAIDKLAPIGVDSKGRSTVKDKARALDPSTATVTDIIDALKAAGLMEN
jgi:hypothetical protein